MISKVVPEPMLLRKEIDTKSEHSLSNLSAFSDAETAVSVVSPRASFIPTKTFFINSHGIGLFRLPLPSSELEINIHNADGSIAYVSKRGKRCSGDATLLSPETGELLHTAYLFGPNRDPIIRHATKEVKANICAEDGMRSPVPEIRVTGKWNSRTQYFTTLYGDSFQWRYIPSDDPRWDCKALLVLEKLENNSPSRVSRRIAQLVRNKQTRPEGTSKSCAGNGGELMLNVEAMGAEIDETLVAATCLLMLKKEIDRRRMVQMMVLGGMAAGS